MNALRRYLAVAYTCILCIVMCYFLWFILCVTLNIKFICSGVAEWPEDPSRPVFQENECY